MLLWPVWLVGDEKWICSRCLFNLFLCLSPQQFFINYSSLCFFFFCETVPGNDSNCCLITFVWNEHSVTLTVYMLMLQLHVVMGCERKNLSCPSQASFDFSVSLPHGFSESFSWFLRHHHRWFCPRRRSRKVMPAISSRNSVCGSSAGHIFTLFASFHTISTQCHPHSHGNVKTPSQRVWVSTSRIMCEEMCGEVWETLRFSKLETVTEMLSGKAGQ